MGAIFHRSTVPSRERYRKRYPPVMKSYYEVTNDGIFAIKFLYVFG